MNLFCLGSERHCLVFRRPPTYSLPPMPGFVYSSLIPPCPRIRACSINLIALAARLRVFRIARRLFRPGNRPSSFLRMSLSLGHFRRTWATVCRLSPQSHLESMMPGTCRLKRKSLSPIFSVLICTRSALLPSLRSLWSCSTFFMGLGVYPCVALPFVSAFQLASHCLPTVLRHHVLSVARSGYSSDGGSAFKPSSPSFLHPVASLAAWSAASFPSIPSWAGIHRTSTTIPLAWSCVTRCAICLTIYAPDRPSGLLSERIAAWLSANMLTRLWLPPASTSACAILSAKFMPCSCAA